MILWIALMFVGAVGGLSFVWDIADTFNGMIIYPNLIALVVGVKTIIKAKDDYYNEQLPIYKAEKAAKKAAKAGK